MASADVQPTPLPAHHLTSTTKELPTLRSNQGDYVAPASTGWMLPTPISTPIAEMRARYERDGYLWVKNVLPREDVLDMREHYFTALAPTGILEPHTSPRLGIYNRAADPLSYQGIGGGSVSEEINHHLNNIHASPTYRAFLSHPSLHTFVRTFMNWREEILLERAMLRHNVPGAKSTGIHYDAYFLRGGKPTFLTAWVPVGDCEAGGGGLMYLEGSNELGEGIEEEFGRKAGEGGLSVEERRDAFNKDMNKDGFLSHDAADFARQYPKPNGDGRVEEKGKGRRWLVGDYEAGDVVFHTPFMVHAATRNEDREGRIRLASDLRFYGKGEEVDERWREVWRCDDGL